MRTSFALPLLASFLMLGTAATHAESITTTNHIVVTDYSLEIGGHRGLSENSLLRVHFKNESPTPQKVKIASHGNKYRVRNTLELQPGAQALYEIPRPLNNCDLEDLAITDSSGIPKEFRTSGSSWSSYYYTFNLYASPSTKSHVFQEAFPDFQKSGHGGNDFSLTLSSAHADPWPSDFRAYRLYSLCALAREEFDGLPAPSQAALLDYAAAGGALLLFGTESRPFAPFLDLRNAYTTNSIHVASVGLGALLTLPETTAENLPKESIFHILEWFEHTHNASKIESYSLGKKFDEKAATQPVRTLGVFLILVLFSILAGPVLLIRLARRNQRIHILWILPALSTIFCVILVTVFLLTNGITPSLSVDTRSFLDQRTGRLLTESSCVIHTPLSLSHDLEIDPSANLAVNKPYHDSSVTFAFDTSYRIRRTSVKPGVPFQYFTRSIARTHRRLEITPHPNGLSVQNLLGEPIEHLQIWDENGTIHSLSNLLPGATAIATHSVFSDTIPDSDPAPSTILDTPPKHLPFLPRLPQKNSYTATLAPSSTNPFVPDPLGSSHAHRSASATIHGVY